MYTANRRTSHSFKASGKKIRPVQDAKLNTLFKTHESKNYALFSSTYPSRPNQGVGARGGGGGGVPPPPRCSNKRVWL